MNQQSSVSMATEINSYILTVGIKCKMKIVDRVEDKIELRENSITMLVRRRTYRVDERLLVSQNELRCMELV